MQLSIKHWSSQFYRFCSIQQHFASGALHSAQQMTCSILRLLIQLRKKSFTKSFKQQNKESSAEFMVTGEENKLLLSLVVLLHLSEWIKAEGLCPEREVPLIVLRTFHRHCSCRQEVVYL